MAAPRVIPYFDRARVNGAFLFHRTGSDYVGSASFLVLGLFISNSLDHSYILLTSTHSRYAMKEFPDAYEGHGQKFPDCLTIFVGR